MEYFTLGLMIFMLIYLLVYNGIELDPISKCMALILMAMCFTTVYHRNIADLIEVGSLWLYFILAYLFFKYLLRNIPIKNILNIIVFAALYPFLNQIYAIIMGSGHMHLGFARYAGTYYHVFMLADYLFFAIPAALYLFITERRMKIKYIYIAAITLFHIGIFMAGYRTNWIAVFVFWTFYILFVSRRKLVSILFISLIATVTWNFVGEILSTKLMPIKTILEDPSPLFSIENYEYNRLLSGRIGIWKGTLEAYQDSDFIEKIIGLGIGSTNKLFLKYMHNEYISALVETGIIGLGMLIAWIYFIVKTIVKKYSSNKQYIFIVLATFISFLVIAFGTMPFRHVIVINYMAIYFATTYNKSIIESIVDVDETS
jgi:O-antigen ligase